MFPSKAVSLKRKLSRWMIGIIVVLLYIIKLLQLDAMLLFSNSQGTPQGAARKLLGKPLDDECITAKGAVEEFPKDFFTQQQRINGGVTVHILIMLYTFGLLAVVCDDYFVISLYHICSRLKLPSDVAGATFMAVGSSAPTLFIAIVSIIFTGSGGDVGLGTVVGSTIFNTLFIIGVCGIAAPRSLDLTWYPLFRDSFVYILGTLALIITIRDRQIFWYEAVSFVFIYTFYILLMIFNKPLMAIASRIKENYFSCCSDNEDGYYPLQTDSEKINRFLEHSNNRTTISVPKREGLEVDKNTEKETAEKILENRNGVFKPQLDGECPLDIIKTLSTGGNREKELLHKHKETQTTANDDDILMTDTPRSGATDTKSRGTEDSGHLHDLTQFEHKQQSPLRVPDGFFAKIMWLLEMPVVILFYITIPPCCKARWSDWFLVTFLMSVLWMGALSYMLVWMVCVIGYTFGIPDCVMGMTFLAAGSSIPDVMASVIVVRQGEGDMALSNAIGSNVFDMLCLGVPWLLKTTVLNPNTVMEIQSKSIMVSALLLLGSITFVGLGIHLNSWKLDGKIGFIFLLVYMVFIALATLVEFIACPCQLEVR